MPLGFPTHLPDPQIEHPPNGTKGQGPIDDEGAEGAAGGRNDGWDGAAG